MSARSGPRQRPVGAAGLGPGRWEHRGLLGRSLGDGLVLGVARTCRARRGRLGDLRPLGLGASGSAPTSCFQGSTSGGFPTSPGSSGGGSGGGGTGICWAGRLRTPARLEGRGGSRLAFVGDASAGSRAGSTSFGSGSVALARPERPQRGHLVVALSLRRREQGRQLQVGLLTGSVRVCRPWPKSATNGRSDAGLSVRQGRAGRVSSAVPGLLGRGPSTRGLGMRARIMLPPEVVGERRSTATVTRLAVQYRVVDAISGIARRPGVVQASRQSSHSVGVTGFEPAASSSRTTRATKLRHTPKAWEVYRSRTSGAPNRGSGHGPAGAASAGSPRAGSTAGSGRTARCRRPPRRAARSSAGRPAGSRPGAGAGPWRARCRGRSW